MRRSEYRRDSRTSFLSGRRRIIAAVATMVAFGTVVTVTQVSDASTRRNNQRALAACDRLTAPQSSRLSSETRRGTYTTGNGRVTQHSDDGASDTVSTADLRARCRAWVKQNAGGAKPVATATSAPAAGGNN